MDLYFIVVMKGWYCAYNKLHLKWFRVVFLVVCSSDGQLCVIYIFRHCLSVFSECVYNLIYLQKKRSLKTSHTKVTDSSSLFFLTEISCLKTHFL